MRYLRNLVASQTYSEPLPWHWTTRPPEAVIADKKARTNWALSPRTNHHCYSSFIGLNEQMRVTRDRGEDGNPPFEQTGFIADFDSAWTEEGLQAGLARVAHAPNYLENTLSNNARLVWHFEKPVRLPGYDFSVEWNVHLGEKLQIRLLLPGLDEGALKAPERYYSNSADWFELTKTKIPHELLTGWFVEFARKYAFKGKEYGEELPIEQVVEMLREKYPRFSEWPNDFAVGNQGPSFWIDGSTSPTSAIVKPGGMISFAAHANKLFYSWSEIIGHIEVDAGKAKTIGKAVENVFFDGKHYFRKLPSGCWKPFEKTDLLGHLKTTCKLSPKIDKGGSSQLDQAIQHIQNHQYVAGAAPFVFRKPGLIIVNGTEYLNTSVRKALQPMPEATVWGEAGGFPFISKWLDFLFDPPEQKQIFIAWLSYFYKNALARTPRSGQHMFIAGGASIGKTLLNRRVIGALVGGFAEAGDLLTGKDNFGSELFEAAHWVVDDETVGSSHSKKSNFTAMLKRMAANNTFRFHAKFRVPLTVEWQGRVGITCNADEESLRVMPDLGQTVLDKLMIFRGRKNEGGFVFPGAPILEPTLDRELPFFARWLADFEIPLHQISEDPRFGILPHHDIELVSSANHSSPMAAFSEMLHDWKDQYFSGTKAEFWEGTSFQLHRSLNADPSAVSAMRTLTTDTVSRSLSALKSRGDTSLSCREENDLRLWKITRPGTAGVLDLPPVKTSGTKFEK
jgi:hypothetical protein